MRTERSSRWRLLGGTLFGLGFLCAVVLVGPSPALAQEEPRLAPLFHVTGMGGISLREGPGNFRIGKDLVTFGVRATLWRRRALQPWLQADRFERPDLICPAGVECIEDGWLLRAGFSAPLSADESEPGVHPYLTLGVGAGIADEATLAYLGGFGIHWTIVPRVAPMLEFRIERVPGLRTVYTLNGGLRIGLL